MSRARALIAVAVVAVFGVVAQVGFFYYRDNFSIQYALKVISARVFRSGAIPYWNFYVGGGQPLAANPNSLAFYPDNVLYLFLPAHAAFNLHFLLHLALAFFAMRSLLLARRCSPPSALFGASLYALSGLGISSTAFYNLVVYVALIPLALNGVERKNARMLGAAFGLMLLDAEPFMLLGGGIAVAIAGAGRFPWRQVPIAVALAAAIGSPQLIAYAEVANEVERVLGFSTETALNASLWPMRFVEIFVWPVTGFLTHPESLPKAELQRLFSTLFLGVIAIPAMFQRSRYVLIAAVMAFLALGRFNPLVAAAVDALPPIRVGRYPEKFAVTLIVALVVLSAHFFEKARGKRIWIAITFLPLLWVAVRALPIDWFAPYRTTFSQPRRVYREWPVVGRDVRASYRRNAKALAPFFGASAGLQYVLLRSPDDMHSLLSRLVAERFDAVPLPLKERYLRIAGADVPDALPYVFAVPRAIGARDIYEAVRLMEKPDFDEHRVAVAPARLNGFASAPATLAFRQNVQSVEVVVQTPGPALLFVNESYFAAWVARAGDRDLETFPLDVDRLGVLVPAGSHHITLTFGRRRLLVAAAFLASSLLLIASAVAIAIEERQRRAGEVERARDHD